MSYRKVAVIAGVVLVVCAAGYFYLHARSVGADRPLAFAAEGKPLSAPSAENPASTPVSAPSPERAHPATPAPARSKVSPPKADAGLPLRSGEVLQYTANVANLSNVANLTLQVGARKDFFGKNAWHLQAFAHTESPLRMVFELDDQFDSYSDAASMTSIQYEMRLNERGQKQDSIQRMTSSGGQPAPPGAAETRVLPGTRDPLGMLAYLRNVDWTKTPEVHCPVYDGHKLYDVRAKLDGANVPVSVPAGNYETSKIEIRVFENGQETKDAHFTIYIAKNAAHTPVLLEAVIPVATARVELLKAK